MAAIALNGVRKAYGEVEVIRSIDLAIESGEFLVLVGPSGCGKSTLLRMVAGLEDISGGAIEIAGQRVDERTPAERDIAMVFQDYALYPHMSVRENMSFGLKMRGAREAEIGRRVAAAAAVLKIGDFLERRPAQLSGGQRQRVAMGRAIVREPAAFLFDEPLSNLDAALRVEMRLEIAKLHHRMRATTIYVTHDQVEAMTLADRIVVMNRGHVEQIGRPLDLYHRPATLFVARFIGSPTMNTITTTRSRADDGSWVLKLPLREVRLPDSPTDRAPTEQSVTLGLRPEDLVLCPENEAVLLGDVVVMERLGAQSYAYVELPDGKTLTVECPRGTDLQVGQRAWLTFHPERIHLFDGEGRRIGA